MAQAKHKRMRDTLAKLAEPTEDNDPGADYNPKVAKWVDAQVEDYLNARRATGLLCYEDCTPGELLTMAHNRGFHSVQPVKVIQLVDWLRKADSEAVIRFTEIRDDTRKLVYEWLFAALDVHGIQDVHQQPAITRTSRKVRAEALPVFYNNCTFQLHYTSSRKYKDHVKYPRPPLKLSVDSGKFLKHVSSVWLRTINRIDLNIFVQRGTTTQLDLLFRLRTDFECHHLDHTITNRTTEPHEDVELVSPIKEEIEGVLQKITRWWLVGRAGWKRAESVELAPLFERLAVDAGAV